MLVWVFVRMLVGGERREVGLGVVYIARRDILVYIYYSVENV